MQEKQTNIGLYVYIDGINDIPFYGSGEYENFILLNGETFVVGGQTYNVRTLNEHIVIHAFTYQANRMGAAPTISCTLMHQECLDDFFKNNIYALFNNEKYFLKQIPTSSYSSEDIMYKHELEFVSERIALENVYFYDVVNAEFDDDKPVSNKSEFSFSGDIHQFAERLNQSLQYAGLEYSVVVDDGIESDDKLVTVENNFFSAVLQDIYNVYDLPYYFVGKVIHIGHSANAIDEVFSYGAENALLSVTKTNAGNRVINRVTGLGSEDNIPYYYPNLSPKGDIKAEAGKNNTGITDDDITIIDYEKYAENVELDGVITVGQGYSSINDYYIDYGKGKVPYTLGTTFSVDMSNGYYSVIPVRLYFKITVYQPNANFYIKTNIKADINGVKSDFTDVREAFIVYEGQTELAKDFLQKDGEGWVKYNVPEGTHEICIIHNISYRGAANEYVCTAEREYKVLSAWYHNGKVLETETYAGATYIKGYGLKISGTAGSGDTITQKLVRYINPQKNLMPPIYRQTDGAERFYNALNNEYQNPEEDEGIYYEFENPFVEGRPKEQIVQFDELKPTIKDVKNSEGLRIDMFSEFAYDRNDNDDLYTDANGQTNYTHPYFFGKLRKLDFNLFDSAIDEGEMTIAMTSGNCGACEFIVGVDSETKQNTVQVDENGNLIYDSNGNVLCGRQDLQNQVDAQPQQQDTINNEVWIALEKDNKTFGVLIPNIEEDYKPKACTKKDDGTYNNDGDTFVILHINLPQLYIEKAEEDLYDQIIRFMYDNNFEKFNFSIKFSRIYLAEHPEILALLDENARIKILYNGQEHLLYVSSFTYTVTDSEVLPEITVELKDNLAVSQNAIQRAVNKAVVDVYKTIGNIDVVAQANEHFLRSDQPDVAYQQITFDKTAILKNGATVKNDGIKSDDYYSDIRGLAIRKDSDGNWHIETDYLKARKKFSAKEVEIQKVYHIGGAQIKSSANMLCSRVEDAGDAYRCYMETTDDNGNTIYNKFVLGDQAYVQTFNLITDENGNTTNHFYWRLVTGVGDDFILLSKTICAEGSTIPMVGDNIVQLGCQNGSKPERMVAVIDAGAGDDAPYYRQFVGIRDFSLPEPETQLKPNDNIISGKIIFQEGSYGLSKTAEWGGIQQMGITANQALLRAGELADELSSTQDYIAELNGEIGVLNKRLDGVVENYFYEGTPTTGNYPVNSWVTDIDKINHIGDTYTNINEYQNADGSIKDNNAGKSWRWCQCLDETITDYVEAEDADGNSYRLHWHPIADSDAVLALKKAAAAQNTADKKIRTFVVQPTTPYYVGDFWYDGDTRLKVCINSRTTGSFNANDWVTADSLTRYGQNLVKGTGTPIKKESHWESNYDWYSHPTSCVLVHKLEKGKTYTVTCQTTGEWSNAHNPSVQSNKVTLWITDLTNYSVIISDVNTSTGTTFVWNRDYFEGYPQKIRFNTYGKPQQFWNLKIEEGDTATPWSLAPEEQSVVYHNISSEAPIDAKEGDMWIPSDASHTTYTFTNGTWVISGDSTGTTINNGLITSGTIQLGDPNYTAKAGITGAGTTEQSVRIWAGSGETDKDNAPFRVQQDGTMYASRGVFGGLIIKSKTILNESNIVDYLSTEFMNNGTEYVDLTKTGSFIECTDLGDSYLFWLKGISNTVAIDSTEYKDSCRSMVGNTLLLYNNSLYEQRITGVTARRILTIVDDEVTESYVPFSFILSVDRLLKAECKLVNNLGGNIGENIVWVCELMDISNS